MLYVRQGATHKVVLGPAVAVGDGFTPVTTLTLSGADEAEVILHDNGTVVDISGYTFAAITTADGYYHLTLQSGISNTVGHMTVVVNDDSLILPLRADFTVVEEAIYDALFAGSANAFTGAAGSTTLTALASGSITAAVIATGAIDADAIADNAIDAGAIAADAITAAKIADGAIDAATFAASAITATVLAADCITAAKIAAGAIDAATFAADVDAEILSYLVDDATRIDASALNTLSSHDPGEAIMGATDTVAANVTQLNGSTAGVAGLARACKTIVVGTADAGSTTTAVVAKSLTPASTEADQFNGLILKFPSDTTTAALRGQGTDITDFNHATQTFTVTALTEAPAEDDVFVIE
jgi:hypothetical protein